LWQKRPDPAGAWHLPADHHATAATVEPSISGDLMTARLSLECDGEKRKQRVLESGSRLREYPGHPMILTVSSTAAGRRV
jgi:hypothetical protein